MKGFFVVARRYPGPHFPLKTPTQGGKTAIDERSRHELFVRLEQVLGSQEAATLMEHLPPVGWADVATKHDLEVALEALESRMLATFRGELVSLQRHMTSVCIGSMVGLAGLAFAAARLV